MTNRQKRRQFLSNISTILLGVLFFSFMFTYPLSADERTENIDVFLVLDKSLSMVEEIDSVTDYVVDELVEKTLIPGDFFLVIDFYGSAELLLAQEIGSTEAAKSPVIDKIRKVVADGHFTDIGNALDTLKTTLQQYEGRHRRRYMLLITDGKQEAPPESKYYSPDGSFNHEFLENSKVIQKEGWKIHILGIGTGNAARELAETLSGTYSEVEENPTEKELADSTRQLLGIININGSPRAKAISKNGESRLYLTLKSTGYDDTKAISIKKLFVTLNGSEYTAAEGIDLSIPPNSEKQYTIPFSVDPSLIGDAADRQKGQQIEMRAEFADGPVFTPAIFTVEVAPPGFISHYWPLLLAVLLILLAVLLVILLISKGVFKSRKLAIEVDLEDSGKVKFFDLPAKAQLFVSEGISGIDVGLHKAGDLLATLHSEGDNLIIRPEKDDILLGGSVQGNVLGKLLKFRDRYGKFKGITFLRKK